VTGTATSNSASSSTPLAGAAIELLKSSDDSVLGSATSGADGSYTMTITTNGAVVDGYVKATGSGVVDTYTYPPAPLAASAEIDSALITTSNFGLLGGVSGQSSTMGFIAVTVTDASGTAIDGAAIASSPASGKYYYDSGGIPSAGSATSSDGQGYFVNVPSGAVTINATKTGLTFKSHVVKAPAGAFTNTTITE
jgi:hypothetical protein